MRVSQFKTKAKLEIPEFDVQQVFMAPMMREGCVPCSGNIILATNKRIFYQQL